MKAISNDDLQAFFRAIEKGEIRLVADQEPQDIYAGVVSYEASNGWRLLIFNDANEYDYVEEIRTPDDRYADINDIENSDWRPDDETAWRCLGIPGYCTFRCIDAAPACRTRSSEVGQ